MCDAENWERGGEKTKNGRMRGLFQILLYFQEKKVFLLKLNYFCLQVLFVIYL